MPHLAPEIGARRPLSLAQERLWFLGQLAPSCSAFNLSYVAQLRGHLDIDALGESLDDTVRRHDILRSTFVVTDGRAVQVITPDRSAPVPLIDLREIDSAKREAEVHRLVHAEVHRPFELATDPLLRATVLRLDETEHVFVLVTHGIVADDRSMGLLLQELSLLYSARISGRPGPFLAPPVEYADYATRQRRAMQDAAYLAQEEYWTRKLAGAPAVLDLFPDRPRPAVQTFHGDQHALHVPEPVWTALMRLSRQEGVTPFVTLLAAFQTLLLRRTAQTDLVIGVPSANRASADTASLCGPVATMLAIRCDLTGNPSFRQLLRRTREAVLDARAHQDVPFERLVEMLRPERSLSYAPLFQVTFDFHHRGQPTLDLQGVTVQPLGLARQTGEFDLSLALAGTEQGVRGYLAYNTDLFEADTIERMAGHFQTLLQGILAHPNERLSELPLLTDTEQRLRRSWNATRTAYPQDRCIHHLVEAQVERTPEAVAVVCREERLTYAELNRRANQIAHHLQGLGVGPESIVAICMERSLELVVGLLAIVKAGGAYLPLDPAYPKEPLGFMLEDARASVLLTQERFLEALPEHGAHVVCLDTAAEHLPVERQENPRSEATSRNLAYVIYTSGSTGRPKGVAIEHRSTVALLDWARTAFPSDQLAGVLASTSVCFDLSVFELFVPLSRGGTAILVDNALQLPAMPAAGDVTLINTVPSVMAELLRAGGVPASVRTINLAGEPLTNDLAQQVYQQDTIESVVNLYGPSEDTTYSTFALVQKGAGADPPIGRPVANTQVHLLDRNLKPVPVGVPGELYVGGAGLARGYLHRPDLTAERFVPHPFPSIPGERLYRTGDLARYRPDGSIEFLGRIDHQVKIRGFRIELGEIEAVLRQHPAVGEAAVVATPDQFGERRLVGYVACPSGQSPALHDLRTFLQEKLPEYMVPAIILPLGTLPLTPSGKIDRQALPAPESAEGIQRERAVVGPRDTVELRLIQIWEDLLGVRPIGVMDSFFDLGGHSLVAVRLIARIQSVFGQSLPLSSLFQGPTIECMAGLLRQRIGAVPPAPIVAIQPHGSKLPFFCVHPVGGSIFALVDLARHVGIDQPFHGLQAPGLDGEQEPFGDLVDLATHHLRVMQTVQPHGPYRLGGWSFGGVVAFEMARQLDAQGEQLDLVALLDTFAPVGDDDFTIDDAELLHRFAYYIGHSAGQDAEHPPGEPPPRQSMESDAPADGPADDLVEKIRALHVLPPDVGSDQIRWLFHVFRAHTTAFHRYQPLVYPGRLTLFRASEHLYEGVDDEYLGWGDLARGGVDVYPVPGNHYTIVRDPHVQVMAEQLRRHLARDPVMPGVR